MKKKDKMADLTAKENKVYKYLFSLGNGDDVADVAISSGDLAKKLKISLSNTKAYVRQLIQKGFARHGGIGPDRVRVIQVFAPIENAVKAVKPAPKPAPKAAPDQQENQEASLHGWMEQQKELYFKGELSCGKIYLLESLPNWDWISDRMYKDILRKMAKNNMGKPEYSRIGRKLCEFTTKPEEITFKENS